MVNQVFSSPTVVLPELLILWNKDKMMKIVRTVKVVYMWLGIKIYFILCIFNNFKKIKCRTYYWHSCICAMNININL